MHILYKGYCGTEGWLTSTLSRQASMLFCSAVKIHLYDYVVTIIGVTLTTSMLAHIIHRLLRNGKLAHIDVES